jgi:5S rRNA maturation endonuclease (ribonuclease M5)
MDIDDLYSEMDSVKDLPVLVEGPNDKRALERLGFHKVTTMGKPMYRIVEDLQHEEEILLLTDLDAHGKGLYKYFYRELTKRGVRVNNRLRLLIFQTPVRQIEGLANYLMRQDLEAMTD